MSNFLAGEVGLTTQLHELRAGVAHNLRDWTRRISRNRSISSPFTTSLHAAAVARAKSKTQKVSKKKGSKELAQKIHDKAAPFVKWLQEAEEETSDSDTDVEIEYDERAKISKLKEADTSEPANDVNENQKKEQAGDDDGPDDDDIDIDNL